MSRRAALAVLVTAVVVLAACGDDDGAAGPTVPATVPNVGHLPGPLAVHATTTTEAAPPTTDDDDDDDDEVVVDTIEVDAVDDEPEDTIGDLAMGPRVLFLGDSVTQSVGTEYSDGVCRTLVPDGWQVAMDAQTGWFIDDGLDSLEEHLAEGEWDAAVLNFGSNYRGGAGDYGLTLRRMLNRLLPRPVLLVTVSEPQENRAEVNYVLREAARRYENVRLLEWSEETRLDGSLTAGDGLHLSSAGQERLAAMLGAAMGEAPGDGDGACLPNGDGGAFDDDGGDGVPGDLGDLGVFGERDGTADDSGDATSDETRGDEPSDDGAVTDRGP